MTTTIAPDTTDQQRRWWSKPRNVAILLGVGVFIAVLGWLGTRDLTFTTDVQPDGSTTFDWAFFWSLVPDMLSAMAVTAWATVTSFVVALVLGLFMAIGRRSKIRWISWPVAGIIEFIRSTPLLVQLFFLYYGLPSLGIVLGPLQSLTIGLGVHYATYCSEAYRAGINSVPNGQWEAATAMNLKPSTTWTRIIIPQAVPNVLPALGNFLVAGFKDAPLGFTVGVTGLMFFATTIQARYFRPVEPYILIGIGFLLVSLPAAWLVRRLERYMSYERI